ncbi:MAG: peptide-methionine (S)-S-oxide reductase MsrA [Candidatus Binataceae bacterium]|nr:peptide-methionine (S)-S-oxide reductase MsrA [Candidatus Binataceae bacterium]
MDEKTCIAVFGGGCFWCTEAVFERLRGVVSVKPGYAGGTLPNPTYRQVCTGGTGHAEVVRVEYNPVRITYKDLLTVFFATHDPTTLNRQGADVGPEYRSIILYTSADQQREAEEFIKNLAATYPGNSIVTEITPLKEFYEAEDYHHEYFRNNELAPYCQYVIHPKVEKVNDKFSTLLK